MKNVELFSIFFQYKSVFLKYAGLLHKLYTRAISTNMGTLDVSMVCCGH